ncbi:MAG: serine/threonine-protein kinase [Vicinamibacterales bacterium]
MVGSVVGKYRVFESIGRGSTGTVYRAIDETLHRDVALKALSAEASDADVVRRFRAEAVAAARLNHPGLATIYELFEHDGHLLMAMEHVRGETLARLIERTGPQAPERAAHVCMSCLAALAHAHEMGVVHRDLKPANIMVAESGSIKIMDFGIARLIGTERLTKIGFVLGTPAYMAPEQIAGQEVDARADLYSMGVVFYRMIAGCLPFAGTTPVALLQAQLHDEPTPIGSVRGGLPAWVDRVLNRALQKRPENRFQSALEFHDALSRAIAPAAEDARPAAAPREAPDSPEEPSAPLIASAAGRSRAAPFAAILALLAIAAAVYLALR